jgi:hypothetical protein
MAMYGEHSFAKILLQELQTARICWRNSKRTADTYRKCGENISAGGRKQMEGWSENTLSYDSEPPF